jgi:hypothetical protein
VSDAAPAPSAKRPLPLGLIGVVLLLLAAALVAAIALSRHKTNVNSGAEANTACRAFEDVYGATKPGTPMNGNALASNLEQAIGHMHKAASADSRWRTLASSLDNVGAAVNAGDATASFAAMQDVHQGCSDVLNPADRSA